MIKVTDLEKFAQEQIYNPYKSTLDKRYEKLFTPVARDLDHVAYHLMNVPEWREQVLNRISRIGFYFPDYINHIVVDEVNNYQPKGIPGFEGTQDSLDKLNIRKQK